MNTLSHTPESSTKQMRLRRFTTTVAGAAACVAALTACSGSDNSPAPQPQNQTKAIESTSTPSPSKTSLEVSEQGGYRLSPNGSSQEAHISDKGVLGIMSKRHDLALKTLAEKDPDTAAFFRDYDSSTSLFVTYPDVSQPQVCTGELAVPMPLSEDIGLLPIKECELIFKAIPLTTQH